MCIRDRISTSGYLSYLDSGFAVGIYSAAGARLGHGTLSTSTVFGGVDIVLNADVSLTAGTLYYAAYAAERGDDTTLPYVTATYQHLSLNAGSRILVGQCSEAATGTGATFTLPATCTIQEVSGVPEALRYGGANFLP